MPTHEAGPKAVILFAESVPDLLKIITEFLSRHGYQVLTASSGDQAINLARDFEGEMALLLADSSLPDMPVLELVRKVRALRPGVPVLIMNSGFVEHENSLSAEFTGTIEFLETPVSPARLENKIRELIGSGGSRRGVE